MLPVLVLSVVTLAPEVVNPVVTRVVVPVVVVFTVVPLSVAETVLLLPAPAAGKVCTASAFPTLAPGSENTALAVRQHLVFSAADSQQYAAGAAYPSPKHSHTCTPPVPKL